MSSFNSLITSASNYAQRTSEYAGRAYTFINLPSTTPMIGVIKQLIKQQNPSDHFKILKANKRIIYDFMKSINFDKNQILLLLNMYNTNKNTINEIINLLNEFKTSSSGVTPTQSIPTNPLPPVSQPVSNMTPQQKEQRIQYLESIMGKNYMELNPQEKNDRMKALKEYKFLTDQQGKKSVTFNSPSSSSWWGGTRRTRRPRKQHKKLKSKRSKTHKRHHR